MAYCTKAGIEAIYGVTNVATWADMDEDEDATKIAARIALAISVADAEIDDFARLIEKIIPLADADGTTPVTITNLAGTMAGIWLYEARGSQDFDQKTGAPYHRLAFKLEWVQRVLDQLRTGRRKIDAL
jgi:hypothetical protein